MGTKITKNGDGLSIYPFIEFLNVIKKPIGGSMAVLRAKK